MEPTLHPEIPEAKMVVQAPHVFTKVEFCPESLMGASHHMAVRSWGGHMGQDEAALLPGQGIDSSRCGDKLYLLER